VKPNKFILVVLAALLIFGIAAPRPAAADVTPSEVNTSLPPGGSLDASELARLERAIKLNPIHPGYRLRLATDLARDTASWNLESYADARESAEHAVRLQPMDAGYRRGLARVEAEACRSLFRDEASRGRAALRYLEAEARARYDPFLPLELAMFLIDVGDPAGARRAAERALSLEPESVLPRLVLADALLAEGGPAAAGRAEALVAEAQEKAERWSSWAERSEYAVELLTLDPEALQRVGRRLGKVGRSAAPEGGPE